MKRILLFFTLLTSVALFSQIFKPVKWETSIEKVSDKEYVLVATANIEEGWAIYGQNIADGGPVKTSFVFQQGKNYELVGKTEEFNGHEKFDKTFEMNLVKFYEKAIFKQRIKLNSEMTNINAQVEFMSCNDERCLPPDMVELVFKTSNSNDASAETETEKVQAVPDEEANMLLYGMTKKDLVMPTDDNENTAVASEKTEDKKSLVTIFFIAFLSGLAALLTPCVFPMIPMTVSYFTKQSKTKAEGIKNAIFYGISIIAIYVLLGYSITKIFGVDSLNAMAANVWFNLIFFALLVVFAFSFFGYFEITLPSSWSTKIDSQADRGGFIGIFFMALALAIVSFSCTGPIIGSLLVEAVSKGGVAPLVGMFGFSFAIALPFALFSAFPGWLNSLPQSGGWMTSVKVVLGFLELALAFKFLSAADLGGHWGILKYETFMIIWIIIFGAMALYLFGKIKFPHDSPIKKLSMGRIFLGTIIAGFTLYLFTGFRFSEGTNTYKPLPIMSGLAPSAGYSYMYPNHCPNNLPCFKDLKKGLEYAKEHKMPIMLDFTGYSCVNCRNMEDFVWSKPKVDEVLRNDYVLISLYVDDNQRELPKNEQIVVNDVSGGTRKLTTYGQKWSHLQAKFFNINSQPYYVLLNYDGKHVLNKPVGYTPNENDYLKWLEDGKAKVKEIHKNSVENLFEK